MAFSPDRVARDFKAEAGNGSGRFLMAWQDNSSTNWDIYGQSFQLLQAGFTASPRSGAAPLQAQLSDASARPTSWL
jgi:PKD repeat protein